MENSIFELPEIALELQKKDNEHASSRMGLIGFPSGGDKIRRFLKQYNTALFQDKLIDMGDLLAALLPDTTNVITDLVEEGSYLPIVLMHSTISKTIDSNLIEHFHSPKFICSRLSESLYNYHCIGLQGHLMSNDWIWDTDKHLRLGQIHESIDTAEVLLRNADYVDINLNVLRLGDLPGSSSPSSAGLSIEELCQIAKFVGASTKLKAITISGYNENSDIHGIAARNVAMLIWYIMDGFLLRQRELEQVNSEKTYTIIPDAIAGELTFIEHQRTGRWWVEVYIESAGKPVRLACSKEDYEAACQNDISDRITSLLSRV
ncbi:MAG: hypothetical protein ACI9FN_001348 [Saprospiraceae bacterium]|jgi:hypothetical protein